MDTNSSLYPLKKDGEAPFGFTKLLRLASGQDVEPEFVLVEHSYSRPWNWQSESSHSHPRKTLFLSKVATPHREDIIDVVKTPPSHTTIPYELVRGKHLMSECERHVVFSKLNRAAGKDEENEMDKEDSDWEQTVNKTGWTEGQHNLFERIVKILDADRLARLTLNNSVNEPIKRRAQIDKTAGKFRHTLGRINWDMKLCQWLHTLLLQSMNTSYLAAYLDILQTLMAKIPNLVEKMLALPSVQKGPNIKALNLLLKRPWDPAVPVLTQEKASKLESLPIIIHVPSGTTTTSVPHTSRRIRFFNSQLQHLAKCISLSVTSESSDAGLILEQIICEVQARIIDCKNQYPSHPIVLLGWGVGAVLACYVSLIEKVSANVCLGFPMMDHKGGRGEPDDPLLEMRTPTLFVVGERATNMTVENLEEFRYRMTAETSLVVVSGADLMLKMIVERRARDALTQSMVDRCIVDEIGDFLTQTFSEETSNKSTSSSVPSQVFSCAPSSITASSYAQSSSFTNPGLLPKVGKRDVALQRKRKLSPMSLAESASLQAPPKIIRTGTAISQTLGLKIPVGVSSVASLMKQEMKTCSSSVSLISATESEEISGVGTGDSVQKTKTFKASDVPSSVKSTFAGPTDGIVTTNPKPSISSQGPFDSSSLSSLSVPGTSLASLPMSCGSPSYATIPLGSFASLTRQRHQQMMQQSEHDNDPALTASANSFDWKYTKPSKIQQEDTDMDVDICGLSSGSSVSGGGDWLKDVCHPLRFSSDSNVYPKQFSFDEELCGNVFEGNVDSRLKHPVIESDVYAASYKPIPCHLGRSYLASVPYPSVNNCQRLVSHQYGLIGHSVVPPEYGKVSKSLENQDAHQDEVFVDHITGLSYQILKSQKLSPHENGESQIHSCNEEISNFDERNTEGMDCLHSPKITQSDLNPLVSKSKFLSNLPPSSVLCKASQKHFCFPTATESLSSRDNGTGGEPLSDRDSYQQEKQHPASSCASSEVSTAGHILVTSSFVSSASTVPTKAPVALKRGRPPGRTKGSTGGVRGRGREPSTSMAVLTFTGAAGNGSGVESAGKGISSLGRGVLTLSKGGTSTVRVFSASGQKMSSSPSVMTSATTDSQNEAQKQKSFLLTNISATGMGSVKGTTEKGVMTGKGQTKPVCNSDISGNDASTTPAQITATTCSSSSSSQASLNLQGISASRTVSFGSTKPTTVMLLPSSITSTSAIISAPNGTNNTTTTNTTTTITSGGLKTTKSVFGLCSASEESKVVEEVNVTDLTVPAEGSEYITCLNKTTQKGHDGTDKEKDEMVTSKSQRRDDSQDTESEESDASKPVSESKTQTALVLGTKVFPSVKSNLTFISSKALGKVFPVSDKLSVQPSLQGKSLLNTNPGCTLLKMAPKTSSIRLVRSVGTSLSSSGTLKATSSNSSSVGNIVTKTFTISNNSFKGPTNKRRMSFDSAICSVSKRSRGTSTDIMIQEPTHKDAGTTISPSLSASCTPDSTLSSLKSVTTASQSISTDESEVSNEAAPETPTNATVCPNTVSHPTSSTQTNDSIGGLLTPSNSGRPKILRQLTVNKKVSTELPTPITKIVSPPKGQMVTIPGKDAVTTNIKVTKELVTSSLTLKSSTLPLVPFQDREYVRTISAKTETETENEPSESEEKGEFEEEAKPVSLLSKEDAAPLTSSGKCDVTLSSEIESELPKLAEKEKSTLLLPQSSSVLSSSEKASEHLHDNVRVSGNEGEITPRDNVPSLQPFKEESSSAPLKLDEESSISQKALCETVSTSETDKETSQSLPKSEEEESNLKTSRMSIQKPDSRDPLKLDKESSKPQKALCETVSTSETDKETSQSLSKSEEEESKLKTTRMSIQKPESRDPLKLDKESSKPQKALCETASTSETDKETSQSLSKSEEEESNLKTSRMSIQKPESRDPLKLDKEFSRPQKALCEIASTSETDKETSQSLSKSEEEESKLKTSRMSIQKRESRDPLKLDKESSIPQKARCETASTSETDKEMSQSLSKSEEEGSDVKTSRMSIQKPEIKDQSGITQKALCEIASTSESDKETSQSLSKSEEEESKGKTIRTSVQKPESRDVTKGRKHPHSLVVSSVARKEGTTICGSPNRKMKSKEEDSSPANRITRSTAKSGPAKRRLRSSF